MKNESPQHSIFPLHDPIFEEPLVDSGFRRGNTVIATFLSHPDVIVRWDRYRAWDSLDEIVKAEQIKKARLSIREHHTLSDNYGIATPYMDLQIGDRLYLVTQRVKGNDLEHTLKNTPNDQLLSEYRKVLTNLTKYLHDRLQPGLQHIGDIFCSRQYMYGTLPGMNVPHIYLVDIDLSIEDYTIADAGICWLRHIFYTSKDLFLIEHLSGFQIKEAQTFLRQALQYLIQRGYSNKKSIEYLDSTLGGGSEPNEDKLDSILEAGDE